jgi:hypothetical protein
LTISLLDKLAAAAAAAPALSERREGDTIARFVLGLDSFVAASRRANRYPGFLCKVTRCCVRRLFIHRLEDRPRFDQTAV